MGGVRLNNGLDKQRAIYLENINKITENQIFPNYKALCSYVGQPVLSGNSKKAQIKQWQRYFDFSRNGQKIKIEKTYGNLKIKVDNRKFNGKSTYSKLIEDNFIDYYKNANDVGCKYMYCTLNQIILMCGMANKIYCYKNIYQKLQKQNFDSFNIIDFTFRTKNKFNAIVHSALNSMKKRDIVDFKKVLIISKDGAHELANEDEVRCIESAEKCVLDLMNKISLSDVILAGKYNSYCRRVKKEVLSKINADYFYRGYSIKIKNLMTCYDTKVDYASLKSNLNQEVIRYFNKQAKNRELLYLKRNKKINLPKNYLLQQQELSDLLLKI